MSDNANPSREDRPLTAEEATLVRWLLEHAIPRADDAALLTQLDHARVVSRCPCGCASINFAIGGRTPAAGAGLDVWSIDGFASRDRLPRTGQLRPIEWTASA